MLDIYAQAGVDYRKIGIFKKKMQDVCRRTLNFPARRHVEVTLTDHAPLLNYYGGYDVFFSTLIEGLGNKNWIAELMYRLTGDPKYFAGTGIDTALMAVNDLITTGAMPVLYLDEVAAGNSDWFEDEKRAEVIAGSFYHICKEVHMALGGGESPALRYLIKAQPPVTSAPSFSGAVTGVVPKDRWVDASKLVPGDHILGVASSGIHANGITLVIERAMTLPETFFTQLPDGRTLGEHALIPTRSYVALVESLLRDQVEIHKLLPVTGEGLAKLLRDRREYTYHIGSWMEWPLIFQFMRDAFPDITLEACLRTWNCGVGYFVFVPAHEVKRTIEIGARVGYEIKDLGEVKKGEREVIFEPSSLTLRPQD